MIIVWTIYSSMYGPSDAIYGTLSVVNQHGDFDIVWMVQLLGFVNHMSPQFCVFAVIIQ